MISLLWSALKVSEVWYAGFLDDRQPWSMRVYCRARAVVAYDRVLDGARAP